MAFGENVGRAFVALHANGDDVPDDIADALDKMTPKFREAGEEHSKAYSDWFERESKKNSRQSADAFLGGFRDELQKGIKDLDKAKDATGRLEYGLKRLKVIAEDNDRVQRHWLDSFHRNLVSVNAELDRSATRTGKMFGKGSRNDFLNILGASIEGLTRMTLLIPKAAEGLAGMFSGKGGGGTLDLAKIATQFATSVVGIVIGLGALVTVAGAASSLLLGVAAALIGLVASATFAAAALGAVALVLAGPLAVGLTAVVAALVGMDDKTRKLVYSAVDPLIDRFKKAGDAAGEAFGPKLIKALDSVGPALDGLTPFFRRVGSALGDITLGWADMTKSEGFKNFTSAFSDFIPGALRRLGRVFGETLGGIGGILEAAIPIADRFLDFLVRSTDKFNEWANSKSGQEQLADFFERAADSAEAIGGFLRDAVVAVAELFSAGKDSGDGLFEKMSDQLERFISYITDPANQAAIEDFFANGVDVATKLGDAIEDIAEALGKLDTPESRQFLSFLFDGFRVILAVVTGVSEAFTKGRLTFNKFVAAAAGGTQRVGGLFSKLGSKIRGVVSQIAADVVTTFSGMTNRTISAATGIVNWFSRLPGRISGFLAPIPGRASEIFGRIQARAGEIVGNITGFFSKLPGRVGSAVSGVASRVGAEFTRILTQVQDIPGRIVGMFSGLAGRILSAIGDIDIGSLIHVPDAGGGVPFVPGVATGGLFGKITGGPQLRWVGEDGPEAIVPLNRPLNQVDPSVRGLSAIAQGRGGGGRSIDASNWTIVTSGPDPVTVARQVVNDFAAKALF